MTNIEIPYKKVNGFDDMSMTTIRRHLKLLKQLIKVSEADLLNNWLETNLSRSGLQLIKLLDSQSTSRLLSMAIPCYQADIRAFINSKNPIITTDTIITLPVLHSSNKRTEAQDRLENDYHYAFPAIAVVDDKNRFSGLLSHDRLLSADDDECLDNIIEARLSCHLSTNKSDALKILGHNKLPLLPILTGYGKILGVYKINRFTEKASITPHALRDYQGYNHVGNFFLHPLRFMQNIILS